MTWICWFWCRLRGRTGYCREDGEGGGGEDEGGLIGVSEIVEVVGIRWSRV